MSEANAMDVEGGLKNESRRTDADNCNGEKGGTASDNCIVRCNLAVGVLYTTVLYAAVRWRRGRAEFQQPGKERSEIPQQMFAKSPFYAVYRPLRGRTWSSVQCPPSADRRDGQAEVSGRERARRMEIWSGPCSRPSTPSTP